MQARLHDTTAYIIAHCREVGIEHALPPSELRFLKLSDVATIPFLQPVWAGCNMCVRVTAAVGETVCAKPASAAMARQGEATIEV
jgi:hypothetical protein